MNLAKHVKKLYDLLVDFKVPRFLSEFWLWLMDFLGFFDISKHLPDVGLTCKGAQVVDSTFWPGHSNSKLLYATRQAPLYLMGATLFLYIILLMYTSSILLFARITMQEYKVPEKRCCCCFEIRCRCGKFERIPVYYGDLGQAFFQAMSYGISRAFLGLLQLLIASMHISSFMPFWRDETIVCNKEFNVLGLGFESLLAGSVTILFYGCLLLTGVPLVLNTVIYGQAPSTLKYTPEELRGSKEMRRRRDEKSYQQLGCDTPRGQPVHPIGQDPNYFLNPWKQTKFWLWDIQRLEDAHMSYGEELKTAFDLCFTKAEELTFGSEQPCGLIFLRHGQRMNANISDEFKASEAGIEEKHDPHIETGQLELEATDRELQYLFGVHVRIFAAMMDAFAQIGESTCPRLCGVMIQVDGVRVSRTACVPVLPKTFESNFKGRLPDWFAYWFGGENSKAAHRVSYCPSQPALPGVHAYEDIKLTDRAIDQSQFLEHFRKAKDYGFIGLSREDAETCFNEIVS